jgi:hypothetical protein
MALITTQLAYLQDAYAKRNYLIELDAYNLATEKLETLYYSTGGFTTSPTDTPANTYYESRVKSALSMSRNMYSPGSIGGRSIPSFGTIKLMNTDGDLDFLNDYSLNGRDIKVKIGDGSSYDTFFNIFVGTMDQIEWSAVEVLIKIRDFQHKLDKPIEEEVYVGTSIAWNQRAQGGGTALIILDPSSSTTDHYYRNMDLEITGGKGYGQKRKIDEYDGTSKYATIKSTTPWVDIPDATSIYTIFDHSNGADRLKNKIKPVCYGEVSHIEPIEVDPSNRIFQVHNGPIESIDAVYSGGNQLGSCSIIKTPAYTNAFDCETDMGTWTTTGITEDLANGKFTLTAAVGGGSSADYVITADVKGSKEVDIFSTAVATYDSSLGGIVKRIISTKGGLQLTDINTDSFSTFSRATTAIEYGIHGYYVPEGENILNILDSLVSSMGAFYTFDRSGKMVLGALTEPEVTPVQTFTEVEIRSISRRSTGIPSISQTIGTRKHWKVFSEGDMAGAVLSDNGYKYRLEEEFIDEKFEDPTVITKHLLAADGEKVDTYLTCNCMGHEEAKRRQELYGIKRDLFVLKVKIQPFGLDLNDTIMVKIDRYGLTDGKNMRIVSLKEDALKNEVTMEVWG